MIQAIRSLVPAEWAPPSFAEHGAELAEVGLTDLDRIPVDVLKVIEQRAGPDPILALRFADVGAQEEGVILRGQVSKYTPWYFQVRHPRFKQVVAYVHPRPGELYIDYRLPALHDAYGMAIAHDRFYGIGLTVSDDEGFAVAVQLLRDALNQPK